MYDLRITGGTIVDGTGKPGFAGDLCIKDGKVAALGRAEGDAAQTINAAGRIVAPGFVDVHTHYDAQILWDRMLSISPWHGVTTTVIGNCGFGVAPTRAQHRKLILQTLEKVEGMSLDALQAGMGEAWPFETFPQYLDAVEMRGSAINVAALFGHTPLRLYVMGEAATERAAMPDEVAAMKRLLREAMEAGAIGFGTSKSVTHNGYAGKPVPSRQATADEMDALVSVMGEMKRGLMQITIGRDFSTREMAEVSRKHGIPVTWTALLSYMYGSGGHRERETFTVEQAVRHLTQRPAETFGIADRGLLAQGRPADVVVFDPKTVGPGPLRRVHDLPAGADRLVSDASGIDAVIVNGTPIRHNGKDTIAANEKLPGRLLRHGRAAS